MSKIDKIKRKILLSTAAVLLATMISAALSTSSFAVQVVVGNQNDVYGKLEAASNLMMVTGTLKGCMENHGSYYLSASDAKKGKIFNGGKPWVAAPLWLEKKIEGKADDGAINCTNGGDSGNALHQFATYAGLSVSQVVCNGGENGLLANYGYDDDYNYINLHKNCSQFDEDSDYSTSDNWETHLSALLDQYRESKNEYMSSYESSSAYLPIDGYFTYLADFNLVCSEFANGPFLKGQEEASTDYYRILRADQNGSAIVFHKYSYHLTKDKSWTYSVTGKGGFVKSCSSALERIEKLQTGDNYNDFSSDMQQVLDDSSRNKGSYFTVLTEEFKKSCANLTTNDGTSSWAEMKEKLKEVIDDTERTDEARQAAQESWDKIDKAEQSGDYTEWVGDASALDTEQGQILQCLDIEGMQIILDEFIDPAAADPSKQASCMDQAGSLGWIVCPLTNSLADAIQSIYNKYIVPFLRIDTGLLDENGTGQNVYNAWKIFQNLANLAFVGLLFVIIFSQLTGFGIDNYGIKKTLPKLIVGAILINFSFLICALAVDLSNIIGYGVGSLFDTIGQSASMSGIQVQASPGGGGFVLTVMAGATVGIGLFAIIASVFSNPILLSGGGIGIIMPILMCLLTVFLGILFTFILLSMRQALAVMLVVVSPLAFACYMLPNTKSLFSKWLKGFEALLVTFPIASALIYGGQAIGKILITAGGSTSQTSTELVFSAAIVAIAPVFMIPSLVKQSMMGIAQVGNAMNNLMGRRQSIRSNAESRLGKTQFGAATQNMQAEARRERMLQSVRNEQKRLQAKKDKGKSLNKYEQKRWQANQKKLADEGRVDIDLMQQDFEGWGDDKLTGLFAGAAGEKVIRDAAGNITSREGEFIRRDGMFDKKGKLDMDRVEAAMGKIGKGSERIKAFNELSKTTAYKEAMSDVSNRKRMASIMGNGNTATEQGIADILRKSGLGTKGEAYTFENMAADSDHGLQDYFNDQGTRLTDSITKHDMKTVIKGDDGRTIFDLNQYLDDDQRASLLSAGMTGDNENALAGDEGLISRMSLDQQKAAYAKINAEQAAGITDKVANASGGGAAVRAMLTNAAPTISADTTGTYKGKLHSVLGGAFGGTQQNNNGGGGNGNGGGGNWRNGQAGNP